VKLLVDMPLSPELAKWLRAEGHDAVHANELSMNRSPDADVLRAAAHTGRVVITADLDFPRLLAGLGSAGPGLILLRGGNYSEPESRDCVRRVLMSVAHAELPKSIVVVDRERIRRRWLPIRDV
jgi:predicted nuclease of predicted toxin-antitoxin system